MVGAVAFSNGDVTTGTVSNPSQSPNPTLSAKQQRSIRVGTPLRRVPPTQALNVDDPQVKQDVVRLIGLYLQNEGYSATAFALQDEANVKLRDKAHKHTQVKRMRQAILDGDWDTVRKLAHKHVLRRNHRSALYLIYRQEYLELIDRHEYQRAFIFLTKRLKPVESQSRVQGVEHEFHDLCYLLTCRSVQDAKSFTHWGGVTSSREKLADHFELMILSEYPEVGFHRHDQESHDRRGQQQQQQTQQQQLHNRQLLRVDPPAPSPDRLVRLLQQAAAYQIEFSPYHPALEPRVESLMEDFRCRVVPDSPHCIFQGHTNNVKCIEFVGRAGNLLTSGSSDRTICVWDLEQAQSRQRRQRRPTSAKPVSRNFQSSQKQQLDVQNVTQGEDGEDDDEEDSDSDPVSGTPTQQPRKVLFGHTSRIWDLSSDTSGRWLASASGDGTVRLWDLHGVLSPDGPTAGVVGGGTNVFGSGGVSGGAGGGAGLSHGVFVASSGEVAEAPSSSFTAAAAHCQVLNTGHVGDVYSATIHTDQNSLCTAGYDKTVRLVDLTTGAVVKTLYGHTAGVTHAVMNPLGNLLVTGSKDSTIRFWDVLSGVCIKTISQLLGEVTSLEVSENGLNLLSASKDSSNRLWDIRTCRSVVRYKGHQNTSRNFIRASFGPGGDTVLGGSEGGRVHVWETLTGQLLERLPGHGGPVFRAMWNDNQALVASCADDCTVRTWVQK